MPALGVSPSVTQGHAASRGNVTPAAPRPRGKLAGVQRTSAQRLQVKPRLPQDQPPSAGALEPAAVRHTTGRAQVSPARQRFHGQSSERTQLVRLNTNGLSSAQVFPLSEVSGLLNCLSAHSRFRSPLPGPEPQDNVAMTF